jgi:hypothetical protein
MAGFRQILPFTTLRNIAKPQMSVQTYLKRVSQIVPNLVYIHEILQPKGADWHYKMFLNLAKIL